MLFFSKGYHLVKNKNLIKIADTSFKYSSEYSFENISVIQNNHTAKSTQMHCLTLAQ